MPRSARSSADAISARLRDLELLTKGPAWALTRSAPWVIAVLQASFTRTRPQLPLEEFHADVDSFLEQLRRQEPGPGGAAIGTSSGRNYADEWTRKHFLTRRNQSGQIVYEVTEPAARVLAFLDSLSSERSTLNGSRLGTLLGDVEKLANETNPDQSARLESLEDEIGERQQLIQDISSGDFDGLLDDDEAVEAAGNILDLAASLPADYKKMRDRIEELVGELRNQIIEESLSKGATMAQVLDADKRLRQSPRAGPSAPSPHSWKTRSSSSGSGRPSVRSSAGSSPTTFRRRTARRSRTWWPSSATSTARSSGSTASSAKA
ncbi:conserved hypothetical protein [Arthrobacter sp. Hiyo4]|nr:conserved hypothetical protein [Arthrobacter sp. Hiyo4]